MTTAARPRRELASVVAWNVRVWQLKRAMHHISWSVSVGYVVPPGHIWDEDLKIVHLVTRGWANGDQLCYNIWTKDGFTEHKDVTELVQIMNPSYDLWEDLQRTLDSWAKVEWDARGLPI